MSFPGRYVRAVGDARRYRSLPAEMSFTEAYEIARSIGITQKRAEIEWLFEQVRALQPRVVLEVGLDHGGTLFLWTRASARDARLASLDLMPAGTLGRWSAFPLVRRSFARPTQRVSLLMGVDSHDPATFDNVASLVGGRTIDFLFIDGDHSYDGVWEDFRAYSRLVRPGGLVAFHDVSQTPTVDTEGTSRFWAEFVRDHETDELVAEGGPGFGIGLYRVPA